MNKSSSLRRIAASLLVTVVACSLPSASTEQEGPLVLLTADSPSVLASVTLCMDSGDIKEVYPFANVDVEIAASGGATGVVRGSLDGTDDEGRIDEVELGGEQAPSLGFSLDPEGPWAGRSGRRCSDPQLVRFEYEGDDEAVALELSWTVVFAADYTDGFGAKDDLDDEDLSVEIELVEP